MTENEITHACAAVPRWEHRAPFIERTVEFPTFPLAIEFVNRVAVHAEAADHHPDIDIRYKRVRLALTTHSAGALTIKDFDLARQIDQIAGD